MFDIIDTPARVMSYRDAGYDREESVRLAHIDAQDAAEELIQQDYANPVSVEIAELAQEPLESGVDDIANEKYETAYELKAIIGACSEHGMGMSDTHYRIAAAIQNNLNCRYAGEQCMVKLESIHANQISQRDLMLHFEDTVGQTLKNLWQSIRNSFINTFNKIKTWYIKAFDGTQRLGNKAKAIKTQAEGKQGTINQQSFDMGGLKTLSMNGKAPEQAQFTQTVQMLSGITQNVMGNNAEFYNKFVERMTESLKSLVAEAEKQAPPPPAQSGNNTQQAPNQSTSAGDFTMASGGNKLLSAMSGEVKNLQDSFNKILEPWNEAGSDERFKDLAANQDIKVTLMRTKGILPGDKMFVISLPDASAVDSAQSLTALKLAFGGTVESINPKPRELEDSTTFKTLNTSQVVTICDSVMDACKAGLDYKLLFSQRDKMFANLGKELDQTVNQADKLQGKALTFVKGNVSAATAIFSKINNIEGKWFRYSMGVFSKAIDYCQGSLNQIN